MNFFRIILAIIAMLFLFRGSMDFLKQSQGQTLFKFVLSFAIWSGVFVFSVFPQSSYIVANFLGMGDNLNTLIFTGFIFVFIIIFRLIKIIERLERDITHIVRKEALRDFEKTQINNHSTPPAQL